MVASARVAHLTRRGGDYGVQTSPPAIDMLRVLAPDAELNLEMTDGNSPALFKSGPAYSYLVMPLT